MFKYMQKNRSIFLPSTSKITDKKAGPCCAQKSYVKGQGHTSRSNMKNLPKAALNSVYKLHSFTRVSRL